MFWTDGDKYSKDLRTVLHWMYLELLHKIEVTERHIDVVN